MNWLEKMNAAVDYLERNLAGKISYEMAARLACCSTYHFQRIFSFVADVPLAEYIRRRRLTLAAFDLQRGDMKVIEVALKYGYESPESFARAFSGATWRAPTLARSAGTGLKAYPRIVFQISIKGASEMQYRIEKKGAFVVSGTARDFDMTDGQCFKEISLFWDNMAQNGEFDKMMAAADVRCANGTPFPVQALSWNPFGEGSKFRYMLGIAAPQGTQSLAGYAQTQVPESSWAVFTSEPCEQHEIGPVCQTLNRRIYGEWLPTSNYEMVDWQQELYFMTPDNKVYLEIWAMVKTKAQ